MANHFNITFEYISLSLTPTIDQCLNEVEMKRLSKMHHNRTLTHENH
jgi:hypothetical protein